MVLFGLGEKRLKKRDGQVGPVNPFPPRGSPLMSKISKGPVLAVLGEKRLLKHFQEV